LIPNNKNTFTVDNNLGGDKVKMKISADATVHLMSLLTDLYSDPELACIREYSTNARDSHIDAGNTSTPIRVTTPSALDPYFTVQDFGVGMDERTIREIYSQYGESTKRQQKTTNGSMGIGAKAALGYTNQFTVAGIKDGVKTLVSVSRDEDGSGVMEIVHTGPTTEANGVTIKIPVKPGNSFDNKAKVFFSFWQKGTVVLNGVDPVKKREALTDRIFFDDNLSYDVIVMGNVAYPVDMQNYSISGRDRRKVACYVEMNGRDEVTFTPSREGLIYNGVTKSAVVNLRNEYQKRIREHVEQSIAGAKDYHEAFEKSKTLRNAYTWLGNSVKWNGMELSNFGIVDDRRHDSRGNPVYAEFLRWDFEGTYRPVRAGYSLNYSEVINKNYIIVTGYAAKKTISTANKERIKEYIYEIKKWATRGNHYYTQVYLTDLDEITNQHIFDAEAHQIAKWSDILSSTREPNISVAPKVAGKYHCWDSAAGGFVLRPVKDNEKIIYWTGARDAHKPSREHIKDIAKHMPEYTMIQDNANRHAKLKKDFPDAKEWYLFRATYEKNVAKRDFEKLDAAYFEHYYVNRSVRAASLGINAFSGTVLKRLDMLDDKEYASIARMVLTRPENAGFAVNHSEFEDAVKKARPAAANRDFIKDYPMLSPTVWNERPDAVVEYMNAVYANRKGTN
jgi:hypothetical protein